LELAVSVLEMVSGSGAFSTPSQESLNLPNFTHQEQEVPFTAIIGLLQYFFSMQNSLSNIDRLGIQLMTAYAVNLGLCTSEDFFASSLAALLQRLDDNMNAKNNPKESSMKCFNWFAGIVLALFQDTERAAKFLARFSRLDVAKCLWRDKRCGIVSKFIRALC
jgi:hypothetical protein